MTLIDIIILSNAQTEPLRQLTENALISLLDSEDPTKIRFNILVIESAKAKPYNFPFCRTIYPKESFGYHRYMNIGLSMTQAPLVCLCNNDLIFHPGWASSIISAFDANPALKSASPFCRFNHPEFGFMADSGIHPGYEVRGHVAGWCILLQREILRVTGPLEERLRFWYSDNDYAKTLEKYGIQHALVSSSKVDHLESQTLKTKSERERLQLTGDERYFFEYKWGSRSYFSYLNHKRKQFFKRKSVK